MEATFIFALYNGFPLPYLLVSRTVQEREMVTSRFSPFELCRHPIFLQCMQARWTLFFYNQLSLLVHDALCVIHLVLKTFRFFHCKKQ